MKAIYKGGQFQTGDFAQILTGVYICYRDKGYPDLKAKASMAPWIGQ